MGDGLLSEVCIQAGVSDATSNLLVEPVGGGHWRHPTLMSASLTGFAGQGVRTHGTICGSLAPDKYGLAGGLTHGTRRITLVWSRPEGTIGLPELQTRPGHRR